MKRNKFTYSAPKGAISRSVPVRPPGNNFPPFLTRQNSAGEGPSWLHGATSSGASSRSPRKRLRSPPPSEDLLSCPKPNGEFVTTDRKCDEEQEVDELDLLGTAALVQFELTQTKKIDEVSSSSLSVCIPETATIPVSRSIPSTKSLDLGSGVTSNSEIASCDKNLKAPNSGNVNTTTSTKPTSAATVTTSSVKNPEDEMKQLQEKCFANDGEVKVLRSEKDRYVAELRKKDEQLHKKDEQLRKKDEQLNFIQQQMTSEKRASEKMALKERDSLLTRLQFKEQELRALQEKCAEMEQRQKLLSVSPSASTVQHRLPTKSQPVKTNLSSVKRVRGGEGVGASRTPSPSKPVEFLSSETFMPLSQLNSSSAGLGFNSVPVASSRASEEMQIKRRGSSGSLGGVSDGARKSRHAHSKSGGNRSRSISPSPSDTKKMKRKSMSDKDKYGDSAEDLDGLYGLELGPENSKEQKTESSLSQGSTSQASSVKPKASNLTKSKNEDAMFQLSVPSREINGSQLLMLLSRHNLMRPPPLVPSMATTTTTAGSLSISVRGNQPAADKPIARGQSAVSPTHPQFVSALPSAQGEATVPSAMTGLLSLLSLETKQHQSLAPFSHSTPAKQPPPQVSLPSYGSIPSIHAASIKTPTRKPRLLVPKPHTLARTNLIQSRVRHNSGLLVSTRMRSVSASNSPSKPAHTFSFQTSDSPSHSLIRSISTISLYNSIDSLLASSEALRFSSSSARVVKQRRGAKEGRHHLEIVRQISNFVVSYHREQIIKMQSLQTSSSGDGSSDSLDVTLLPSGRSPSRTSSLDVSSSSSLASSSSLVGVALGPMTGSQQYLAQALGTLETLVTYSKTAREHLLREPLEFVMDSRGSSFSVGGHQNSPALSCESSRGGPSSLSTDIEENKMDVDEVVGGRGGGAMKEHSTVSTLAKVSHRLVALQDSGPEQQEVADSIEEGERSCKNFSRLLQLSHSSSCALSDEVWGVCTETRPPLQSNSSSKLLPQCGRDSECEVTGSGCGRLFPVLMELLYCPWVESRDNVLMCLNVLVELAKDCSVISITRFVPLFQKDTIVLCLEREDHALTGAILSLLTLLVRFESILGNLCSVGDPCILATLYQYLMDPPASWCGSLAAVGTGGAGGGASSGGGNIAGSGEDVGSMEDLVIHFKIIKLLSRILVVPSGPGVLFEKCSCSQVFLRSLVYFLEKMVDNISHLSQWSQKQQSLVLEVISLVYKVSFNDRFFDSHRDNCEHTYSFVFNKLAVLLLDSPEEDCRELSMVNELLVYCEEYEDSPRESSQEDSDRNGH